MKRKLPVNESSSDSDESEVDSDEEVFSFVVFFPFCVAQYPIVIFSC
jgi:hypothetical protein